MVRKRLVALLPVLLVFGSCSVDTSPFVFDSDELEHQRQAAGGGSAGTSTSGGSAGSSEGGAGNEAGSGGDECSDGDTQPCGTDLGNCEKGEQTCDNGVWGPCVGGVGPEPADSCEPGDDADCDGAANEGCACEPGTSQPCSYCGTQHCVDGTWGGCEDPGECEAGETEQRLVDCGNCGTQSQERTCSDACVWEDWTNVGACGGQGECAVGSEMNAADVACGYCGNQPRKQVCTPECTWGPPENNGGCVQLSCGGMPGDERVGFVACSTASNPACDVGENCCVSASAISHCVEGSCPAGETRSECDGPEDCAPNEYCIVYYPGPIPVGLCSTDATAPRRCHADSDCPANAPVCNHSASSNSYGHCGTG